MKMAKGASGHFAIIAYVLFLACIALTGGSSRFDAASQPIARLAAVVLIGALILHPGHKERLHIRPGLWFMAAIAGVIAVQLMPLPPALWTALPARAPYLAAAITAGQPQPWRPINLTPDRGWNSLFALLPPLAALAAAARLRLSQQPKLLAVMLLIVFASAVIGLVQVSGGGDDTLRFYAAPPTGSAVGLFANRNHQALLLCCGIPMLALWAATGASLSANVRIRGAIASAAAAFLLLMIPTTGSRAGLAIAALALLSSIPLIWPVATRIIRSWSPRRRRWIGLAVAILIGLLIATAVTFSRAMAVQRLFATDPVEDARIRLLHPLFGMIRAFLPFGSGFGSFDPVYRGFEPFANLAVTYMNQAHDDYLQVTLEAGLPGVALLGLFLAWWGWTSLRLWRARSSDAILFGRLGSVLLLLMLAASIADYPVRTPLMMVFAAQSACWMLAATRRRPDVG